MRDDKPRVVTALEKLGALGSPDHIALFFEQEGITGDVACSESCPVTNYLVRETGAAISTGRYSLIVVGDDGYESESIDFIDSDPDGFQLLPQYEAVSGFVRDFDHEKYPSLIKEES